MSQVTKIKLSVYLRSQCCVAIFTDYPGMFLVSLAAPHYRPSKFIPLNFNVTTACYDDRESTMYLGDSGGHILKMRV